MLRHLLAIVYTVRAGDPFVADNSTRLERIAWWVLAGEVLRLVIGAIEWAATTETQPLDVEIGFSLAPWLAVPLRHEGVRPLQVWGLRLFYLLMLLMVAPGAWGALLRHEGPWDPVAGLRAPA